MPDVGLLLLMALPLLAAGVVLLARRTDPRDLVHLRVHGAGLLWVGAAVQALRTTDPDWAAPVLTVGGGRAAALTVWALGAVFVTVNAWRSPGAARAAFVLLGLGFTLNTLATVVNDGMPYSVEAGRAAGMSEAALASGGPGHVPVDSSTRLVGLGDVLPVPGIRAVASVGDVGMLVGIVGAVVALVPARRPTGTHGEPTPTPTPTPGRDAPSPGPTPTPSTHERR